MGKTTEELDANDIEFSYNMANLKTQTDDFTQVTKQHVQETTRDLIWEESQRKPRLNAIQFELTSRCNERCIHCYIPNGKKKHGFDMPTEKVKSIIDEFAEMGGTFQRYSLLVDLPVFPQYRRRYVSLPDMSLQRHLTLMSA